MAFALIALGLLLGEMGVSRSSPVATMIIATLGAKSVCRTWRGGQKRTSAKYGFHAAAPLASRLSPLASRLSPPCIVTRHLSNVRRTTVPDVSGENVANIWCQPCTVAACMREQHHEKIHVTTWFSCLLPALLSGLLSSLSGAEYHLSALGDDARDGLTPETAWQSLSRASTARYRPGDCLVLRAGDRFAGSLHLGQGGDAQQPVVVTSSAGGRATIASGNGETGVMLDAGHVTLRGFDLSGPGATAAPSGDGIHLRCATAGQRVAGVVLSDLRVSGFPGHGIRLSADGAGAGVDDLLVEHCRASANGEGGMGSWGPCAQGVWAHHRIVVRECCFHDNRGIPSKNTNHSGNGIILGDVQDAVIEQCRAWGNGADCTFTGGGPVGIWLCEADRSVIRACVSHHNHTGTQSVDGGGFDLDGGCTRCVITGCLSWRNDGAGYLLCQYQGARELRGNQIRDCWSVGDGRAHGYAGLHLWCDPAGSVHDCLVTACTLVMDATPQGSACIRWSTPADAVRVENSAMVALGGAWLVRGIGQPGCSVAGNHWFAHGDARAAREDQTPAEVPGAVEQLRDAWVIPDQIDLAWLKRLAGVVATGASGASVQASWGDVLAFGASAASAGKQ